METFGNRIKEALKQKGKTQRDLAEGLGTSHSLISEYVSGKKEPGIQNARRIAEYLNVDLTWLITGYTYDQQQQLRNIVKEVSSAPRGMRSGVPLLTRDKPSIQLAIPEEVGALFQKLQKLDHEERELLLKLINKLIAKQKGK